jgi:thioredoxin 1
MAVSTRYVTTEPTRAEVEEMAGAAVLEFGSATCGFCRAAQPAIEAAFRGHDSVKHLKIADGSGRPLGRSFRVKLWPTLVFLKDGHEVARLVRPEDEEPIRTALQKIAA